jgi:uncharacterized membrane protein YkvA (DUF1232 family)
MKFPLQAFYAWYSKTLRHPKYRWFIIIGSLVYLFSPLDISPDLFPIIGQVDDVAILVLLVSEVSQILSERLKGRKVGNQTQPAEASPMGNTAIEVEVVAVD